MTLGYAQFYRLKDRKASMFMFLKEKPRSAGELAKRLGLHRATVSAYLNQFVREGRLEKRKKGKVVYYGVKRR